MRILILNWKHVADRAAGGAEHYVQRVAAEWAMRGHEVTLLVPRPSAARRGEPGPSGPVRVLALGRRATIFRTARRHLARHGDEFDWVVESVSTHPFFSHELVGDRALVLYHQIADDVWQQEFPFPVSWIGRRVVEPHWLRRISGARVVANSPSTASDLHHRGVVSVGVVPPGADPVSEAGPRTLAGSPRVIFIGRLVRTKRPLDAVRAFARIRAVFPGATLDVVGDGYLRDHLRGLRAPGVTVHGFVPESIKSAFLARSEVMLLPGTREGWGIVAIEAGLHGVPAVAYDVPGFRDAVVHGSTGVLTQPDPAAMGDAAVALLQDPNRWLQYSQASRQRASFYTWPRAADQLLSFLTAKCPEASRSAA
ncbi:MAG TPA: glycosyltransferase family 4 protein [Candidatus Dormibacteraeota bacterium]|nr:glycosyltransferase family 4 protein [Candidatus Dormibacteraeota bacterium]